jgi:hypothetical protein
MPAVPARRPSRLRLVLTLVAAFLCLSLYPSAQAGAPDPLFAVVCPTTSRRPPKRRCQSE